MLRTLVGFQDPFPALGSPRLSCVYVASQRPHLPSALDEVDVVPSGNFSACAPLSELRSLREEPISLIWKVRSVTVPTIWDGHEDGMRQGLQSAGPVLATQQGPLSFLLL